MKEGDVILIVCTTVYMQNWNGYCGNMQKGQVSVVDKLSNDEDHFKVKSERYLSSCLLQSSYAKVLKVR